MSAIKGREAGFGSLVPVRASYCDPAGRAANVQTAQSEFEVLRGAGLAPQGRASSVRDGCVRIMDTLADEKLPPIVSERCGGLIRALASVKPHRGRPEVYDFEHEVFSHPLDALRYLLVNIGAQTVNTTAVSGGRPVTAGLVGMRF